MSERSGVAFFPSVARMADNPYWPSLISALERSGVDFVYNTPDAFNEKWLLWNRKQVKVLHIHYIHQFYMSRGRHTHFVNILRFAFRLLLARALGFSTIFTLHNLEPTDYLQPMWLDFLGHWVAANLTERVIVHCQEARRLLSQKYGRRNHVFVVDHMNLIENYPNRISQKEARLHLNISLNTRVFLFFGGVRPNKGIEILIKAFAELDDVNLRLLIVGASSPTDAYAQFLQEMAATDKRISFYLTYVMDDEVQIFMNAADIVVLPFAKILTSGSTILAMSFGRPVIVPVIGCLPELIGMDAGWSFEPNNASSLKAALQKAIQSDYRRFGERAYWKVFPYTLDRFAEQTIQIYK